MLTLSNSDDDGVDCVSADMPQDAVGLESSVTVVTAGWCCGPFKRRSPSRSPIRSFIKLITAPASAAVAAAAAVHRFAFAATSSQLIKRISARWWGENENKQRVPGAGLASNTSIRWISTSRSWPPTRGSSLPGRCR